jgi:tRNA pseudouridine13 synthase
MHKFLTEDIPGIGGTIKEIPGDFQVREIPLYPPCGEGEHTFAEIEKSGLTTLEAVRRLSRALNIPEREIGYAGLKDARGTTIQTLSIPRTPPERILALELAGIRMLSALRHRNKLKPGHLAGNSFRILVHGVQPQSLETARRVLDILGQKGVPNYFGPQRYGAQGNSHLVGKALLKGDYKGAIDLIMGDPQLVRDERWSAAITAYRSGALEESLNLFPAACRTERDILQRLLKRPEAWEKAFHAVNPRLKALFISALQSSLFDALLDQRIEGIGMVMAGDLAWKHDNGACFIVEDAELENERAKRFEISPSGPLFGCKMKSPVGYPFEMEGAILKGEGLSPGSFDLPGGLRMEGERRPLRIPLTGVNAKWESDGLLLEFFLPKGAYATSVLRELMKTW